MAVAEINNIVIEKGTDFDAKFKVLQPDSSNYVFSAYYSAQAKIRKYPTSPSYQSFKIDIIGSTGEIIISMAKTTTELLSSGRNYFDILVTGPATNPNGIGIGTYTKKVVEGTIIVSDTATI
jgi:hypothetical protein